MEDAAEQLVAKGTRDTHAHAHLHHERRHAAGVECVRQRALQHGRARMHPDEVAVELARIGEQRARRRLRDAHLWNLPKEDVAGVHVDAHVAAPDVADDAVGGVFRHGAVLAAGEDAVHVQIEARHAARDGVDAQRVERRIDVHDAAQQLWLLADAPRQLVADILPLELVAVRARDDAQAAKALHRALRRQAQLLNAHLLIHREMDGDDLFNAQTYPSLKTDAPIIHRRAPF